MGKNKMFRYSEIRKFRNVHDLSHLRPNVACYEQGRWNEHFPDRDAPLTLELACGKGDYAIALAQMQPERNFIGMDLKGDRLWVGAAKALEMGLGNVRFIRGQIDHIAGIFGRGEVDEIWITFPDPYLREKKSRKRLTSPRFLDRYRKILKEGAVIHLKTDSPELFGFTLETIEGHGCKIIGISKDVHNDPNAGETLKIRTYYENMHLMEGKVIRYVGFVL